MSPSLILDLAFYAQTAVGLIACIGWWREINRGRWSKVFVDTKGRGPNADSFYFSSPPHDGQPALFTAETVLAAKVRASHLLK